MNKLQKIKSRRQIFVIGADQGPVLTRIYPNNGPDTGEEVQVTGKNFDELAYIQGLANSEDLKLKPVIISEKKLDDRVEDIVSEEIGNKDTPKDSVFHLQYENTGNGLYNDNLILKIDRFIATYIGNRTTPATKDGGTSI